MQTHFPGNSSQHRDRDCDLCTTKWSLTSLLQDSQSDQSHSLRIPLTQLSPNQATSMFLWSAVKTSRCHYSFSSPSNTHLIRQLHRSHHLPSTWNVKCDILLQQTIVPAVEQAGTRILQSTGALWPERERKGRYVPTGASKRGSLFVERDKTVSVTEHQIDRERNSRICRSGSQQVISGKAN
ncbi:hypothetical protein J6590_043613 [Homalodisca vitripennis]|nr:hypothetical protein J6590_043613 [Homalodisca vitripennis]